MFLHTNAKAEILMFSDYFQFQKGLKPSWISIPSADYIRFANAYASNSRLCPDCRSRQLELFHDKIHTHADYDKTKLGRSDLQLPTFRTLCTQIQCRCGIRVLRTKINAQTMCFKTVGPEEANFAGDPAPEPTRSTIRIPRGLTRGTAGPSAGQMFRTTIMGNQESIIQELTSTMNQAAIRQWHHDLTTPVPRGPQPPAQAPAGHPMVEGAVHFVTLDPDPEPDADRGDD